MAIIHFILFLSVCFAAGEIIDITPQMPKEEKLPGSMDFLSEVRTACINMATYLADLHVGSVRIFKFNMRELAERGFTTLAHNSLTVLTWALIVILFGAVLLLSKVLDDVSRANVQHQRDIREIKQNREKNSVEMMRKMKKLDPWVVDLQTQVSWLLEENKRLGQKLQNCKAETAILKATVRGMPIAVQDLQLKVSELQSVNHANSIIGASSSSIIEAPVIAEPTFNVITHSPELANDEETSIILEAKQDTDSLKNVSESANNGEAFPALSPTKLGQVHEAAKLLFLALGMDKEKK